jgi:hypothetical protein
MPEPDSQSMLYKQIACFACIQLGKEGKNRGYREGISVAQKCINIPRRVTNPDDFQKEQLLFNFMTWQLKGQKNGARRNCSLLGNGIINMCCCNVCACYSRRTVGNCVFYMVPSEAI